MRWNLRIVKRGNLEDFSCLQMNTQFATIHINLKTLTRNYEYLDSDDFREVIELLGEFREKLLSFRDFKDKLIFKIIVVFQMPSHKIFSKWFFFYSSNSSSRRFFFLLSFNWCFLITVALHSNKKKRNWESKLLYKFS